jgi:hypothetical protein
MVKKMACIALLCSCILSVSAQMINEVINVAEVERIERILAGDDMQGRKPFTPGIDKAAAFIASEFRKAGIRPVQDTSFFQQFALIRPKLISLKGTINNKTIDEKDIAVRSTLAALTVNQQSAFEIITIGARDTFIAVINRSYKPEKNLVFVIDTTHRQLFARLKRPAREAFPMKGSTLYLLSSEKLNSFSIDFKQELTELSLKNVVGVIPGKSKADEYVIFSAHYDHLGIGRPNKDQDSIYNGANDDASGVTAVIVLANYFNRLNDNERTLVFAAFTAEESGGYGANHFSRQFAPDKVMAMFNIEMIGTESKWGINSAFITGYEKTDMGKILEKNLAGSAFRFNPDPYPDQELFYRSDNATLARLGVPAHTISTAKMDSEKPEPYYHSADDEIETLDMKNMTEIIKSIAISSVSIVKGTDTPTRVDTGRLR